MADSWHPVEGADYFSPHPGDGCRRARSPDARRDLRRAVTEGERRLDQPLLELVATSFIAGFTVVFGILFGADGGYRVLAEVLVVATAGNLVGGFGLVTLTHVAQVAGDGE